MCSECGVNVWVQKDGTCQNGHAAECLSGHYDVAASAVAVAPAGTRFLAPADTHHMWMRLLALAIDFVIANVLSFVVLFPIAFIAAMAGRPMTESPDILGYVVGAVIVYGYRIVTEGLWSATPGKRMLGLRVVSASTSGRITWKQSAIRNLALIVDLLFWGLIGLITANSSPYRQRYGDKAAGTVVVRTNESLAPTPEVVDLTARARAEKVTPWVAWLVVGVAVLFLVFILVGIWGALS